MSLQFSIHKFFKSFSYAFAGIREVLKNGQNISVHFAAAVIAVVLGFVLKISAVEFLIVLFCIGLVISLEVINTAIEKICDFVSPQLNDKIKVIKDLGAAAVLVAAITSLIIGMVIFFPKIFSLVVDN